MHQTEHKAHACGLKPWERKNADRVCQHGDSAMLREIKRQASRRRRQADKAEAHSW